MNRVTKYFEALQHVVATEEVRMGGAWAGKTLRPASPEQPGRGGAPPVEALDWRWEGTFDGASSLAGLALLAVDRRLYCVKSVPPVATPSVAFSASAWANRTTSVTATGCFHGAHLPGVPVEITDEPPVACSNGILSP